MLLKLILCSKRECTSSAHFLSLPLDTTYAIMWEVHAAKLKKFAAIWYILFCNKIYIIFYKLF